MPDFLHLHVHTQYSLLDGANEIGEMMDKAKADGQLGVALTDHGNMFGAFKFVAEANKRGIKPIIGCEFYLVDDRHRKAFSRAKGEKDKRYHQLLLAKNRKGYENLCKLCSLGFIEGFYSKFPRIDKELLLKHHEGLIATSCCIGAEIPQAFIQGKDEEAERLLRWWLELLGEDFYIELQRHRGLEDIDGLGISQEDVNQKLLGLARKYNVKVICTNDAHYLDEDDSIPHDLLLCINTGERVHTENRFKFSSSDYYFKTKAEMGRLFADLPESLDNTLDIFHKIEPIKLERDILLPAFPMPEGFETQDDYLRHITYEGAKRRYGVINDTVRERLDFELEVIRKSGYPGYCLIVQDFTTVARQMGVSVGPGRGSAAGSAVAYCVGITNVDPIKYDLLFERFLNPERVSMPDIDIDFDDVGRQQVIDYVVDKYGKNQVAQIITYGSMKAKSSIRDVGRVMDIPLNEVDKVAKTVPDNLATSLKGIMADKDIDPKLKDKFNSDDRDKAYALRDLAENGEPHIQQLIKSATKLEGSVRNTGIHACGVIITPDDITNYVPVSTAKDNDLLVSQFDNSVAEDAGLLKMDFLGLKTLTIIKDAVRMVRENYDLELDMDEVPLDDAKTYELFQRGETIAIFQYESGGMQKHMKALVPSKFEDLIAMNALYRPGPMEYIPKFCDRKHGREKVTYDLPEMEEYLAETLGITVYQEQIMLLSQKLAGFSKGEADTLRKAMGKKKKAVLDKMYPRFVEGCKANGHPEDKLEKIWKDWEAFAAYAFNKSHSTCYALVAYQTAFLKAHYPAEFMASVLTHNKSDITKLTGFLRECKRMGIEVLEPSVNESASDFSVNKKGHIRFGMAALKGVGEGPVNAILEERRANGAFSGIFDLVRRMNLRSINKRVLESLVVGGGFDEFEIDRASYFAPSDRYDTLIDHAVRYGNAYQQQKAQAANSLFGASEDALIPEPPFPEVQPWPLIVQLNKEKEVTGIYLSGHPLDDYRLEVENFTNCSVDQIEGWERGDFRVAGIVMSANHRIAKNGNGYGFFVLQDFHAAYEFKLFGEDYQKFKHFMEENAVLYLTGGLKRFYNGEMRVTIKEIRLLEAIGKEKTQSITIKLPIETITSSMIDQIDQLCQANKGKHKFRIHLIDQTNQIQLQMASKLRKVNADNDFIAALDKVGLDYTLN